MYSRCMVILMLSPTRTDQHHAHPHPHLGPARRPGYMSPGARQQLLHYSVCRYVPNSSSSHPKHPSLTISPSVTSRPGLV